MRIVLSICAAILLIAGAWGQSTTVPSNLPPGLPPLGPLQTVTSPKVEEYRLPNGMQIWLVRRPALPKVALTLLLRGGDSADPSAMPGLAQVLAAAVTQGTTTRSAKQIADSAEFIGGDLSASADVDSIQLSIDPLSEYVNNALALFKDVSQNAAFAPEEVALVTSNLNNARMGQQADPLFMARRATAGIFYPQHPYRILSPSAATLRNATPDSLRALYRQTFRPDGALLIAVGEFDPKSMRAQIEKEFGAWKAIGPPFPTIAPPQTQVDHRVYVVDRPHSVQTTMLISAPSPTLHDAGESVLELADAIYGSGFSSRLRKNIREDKGYSYHPFSDVETHRLAATVQTGEDVRNAVTGASLKETFFELDRMASDPPSAQELLNGKRYLMGNTAVDLGSRRILAFTLGAFWVQDMPADFLTAQMKAVYGATASDVQQAALKYLASHRMTVVAVGEKSVIEEQLRPFGMQIVDAPHPE